MNKHIRDYFLILTALAINCLVVWYILCAPVKVNAASGDITSADYRTYTSYTIPGTCTKLGELGRRRNTDNGMLICNYTSQSNTTVKKWKRVN